MIDNWAEYYSQDPGKILAVQEGGLGWYGALIGGTVAVAVYSRIAKFSLGRFADAVAPGLFLGLAIGRIGCTLNGDSPGAETTLPWGLAYTNPTALVPAVCWVSHASGAGLRDSVDHGDAAGAVAAVEAAEPRRQSLPGEPGALRGGKVHRQLVQGRGPVWGGPLHQSHIISIGIFVFAAVMLIVRKTRLVKREAEPPAQPAEPPTAAAPQS